MCVCVCVCVCVCECECECGWVGGCVCVGGGWDLKTVVIYTRRGMWYCTCIPSQEVACVLIHVYSRCYIHVAERLFKENIF